MQIPESRSRSTARPRASGHQGAPVAAASSAAPLLAGLSPPRRESVHAIDRAERSPVAARSLVEAEGQVWAPPPARAAVQRLVPRSRCPAFRTPRHVLVSQQSREVIKVGGSGLAMRVYQVLLSCKLRSSPPTLLLPLSAHPAIEGCPGRSQPGDAPALGSSGTWRRGGAEERAAFSALLARVCVAVPRRGQPHGPPGPALAAASDAPVHAASLQFLISSGAPGGEGGGCGVSVRI